MINNRQGGRRRGRGGQSPRNLGGRPEGNRQDNRQRGNAAQLLEKYKSMARDAQLGGDRVQTEYYLQYAEHYYRMLGESRARYDEQQRAREENDDENDDDLDGGDDQRSLDQDNRDDERPQRNDSNRNDGNRNDGGRNDGGRNDGNRNDSGRNEGNRNDGNARSDRYERERPDGGERAPRPERSPRPDRTPRYARNAGEGADRGGVDGADSTSADGTREAALRPERAPRLPRNTTRSDSGEDRLSSESISFDALPPAIGRDTLSAPADDQPAAPKRRIRKPRPVEDEGDIAPAA